MAETKQDKRTNRNTGSPSLIMRLRHQYSTGKTIYLNLFAFTHYDFTGFSATERENIDVSEVERLFLEDIEITKEGSSLPSQWTMMQRLRFELSDSRFLQLTEDDAQEDSPTQEESDRFQRLASQWRETRGPSSLVRDLVLNESYQSIIGMGTPAVPLILAELAKRPDHWFWALRAITGANPVRSEQRGRLREMAGAWLNWGKERGYIS